MAFFRRKSRHAIDTGRRLHQGGDLDSARRAYQRAADSGDLHAAPAGQWNLGMLARDAGDDAAAREHYRRTIESGHPAWSLRAALALGQLHEDHGEVDKAIARYEWAVDSGTRAPEEGTDVFVRQAVAKLDVVLTQRGEHAKAQALHDRVTRGLPEERARFLLNRSHELETRGDVEGSTAALREAVAIGAPTLSARAAQLLALRDC
ncbi:tetratricopeptide repeat protein [Labedaea rhizosphaerae]|uniref:Tetratricopeptide repeat protein n=1 Tax=Labedaea rhizosphaerae TaxID=598644 RepID=A0A4R6SG46_LABRH|nr:tetratricopeptide repeat protein [Labedaea rhizosphaerae]TDQ00624.1 tetratricopeptide repeat protein [Labedaea rhizosphaerae]